MLEPHHAECALRTSTIHHPLDLVINMGPWALLQTHEVESAVAQDLPMSCLHIEL